MSAILPDHSLLWTPAFLAEMRLHTDPTADAVVARMVAETGPQEARNLFSTLIRNIDMPRQDLPDHAREFIETAALLPEWADPAKIRLGEKVFLAQGMSFTTFLFYKSLPMCYLMANGANVLHLTGRLMGADQDPSRFSRRLGETAQFIIDVMSPGGLAPGGKGIRTALKVRLTHASIRHFLPKEEWNESEWGKPICQEDMAFTLLTFCVTMAQGLEQFGAALEPEEADALIHSWAVVGHIMGLDERLLPHDYASGKILLEKILEKEGRSSQVGIELTASLVDWAERIIPGKFSDHAASIMIRECLGTEKAEMLGVNAPQGGCLSFLIPRFLKRTLGFAEKLDDFSDPIDAILVQINRGIMTRLIKILNKEKNTRFSISAEVLKSWDMEELS